MAQLIEPGGADHEPLSGGEGIQGAVVEGGQDFLDVEGRNAVTQNPRPNPERLGPYSGVENKVHWVMDVCFREDQSRARAGYAAENLATLRRLALNLLKRQTTKKRGIGGKRFNPSWDHAYLLRLLRV